MQYYLFNEPYILFSIQYYDFGKQKTFNAMPGESIPPHALSVPLFLDGKDARIDVQRHPSPVLPTLMVTAFHESHRLRSQHHTVTSEQRHVLHHFPVDAVVQFLSQILT